MFQDQISEDKENFKKLKAGITVLLIGKQPTCTGNTLADVSQRAQVGLLGLVAMLP